MNCSSQGANPSCPKNLSSIVVQFIQPPRSFHCYVLEDEAIKRLVEALGFQCEAEAGLDAVGGSIYDISIYQPSSYISFPADFNSTYSLMKNIEHLSDQTQVFFK